MTAAKSHISAWNMWILEDANIFYEPISMENTFTHVQNIYS